MLLIIDNYDSFVYNIIHFISYPLNKIDVKRNDRIDLKEIDAKNYKAIIISPGPMGPGNVGLSNEIIRMYYKKIPILGICLGHQCIGHVFGCKIQKHPYPTHGKTSKIFLGESLLFKGIDHEIEAARYHSLHISTNNFNGQELKITANLKDGTIMAVEHKRYKVYGVQFHPESILTGDNGKKILRNFLEISKLIGTRGLCL